MTRRRILHALVGLLAVAVVACALLLGAGAIGGHLQASSAGMASHATHSSAASSADVTPMAMDCDEPCDMAAGSLCLLLVGAVVLIVAAPSWRRARTLRRGAAEPRGPAAGWACAGLPPWLVPHHLELSVIRR